MTVRKMVFDTDDRCIGVFKIGDEELFQEFMKDKKIIHIATRNYSNGWQTEKITVERVKKPKFYDGEWHY